MNYQSKENTELPVRELPHRRTPIQAHLQEVSLELVNPTPLTEDHHLKQIARHIPGVIYQFRMRPNGTFHFPYASEGLQEIYGVSPEEVREDASKVFGIIHPDDLNHVTHSILESAKHLTPWYCEYQVCLANGQLLWLLGHSTPQREPDGSTIWHGYIRDITKTKATELALRISENKFRSIIENLNDRVYIINPDTTFSYLSPQFKEVMGYDRSQLLNQPFTPLIYPEDLPNYVNAIRRSLQGEKLRGIEYRVLHQDGYYYWHSSNLSALRDDEGRVIACLGIARYIHDRKQNEAKLLEISQLQQAILDSASYTIISTDTQGIIKSINAAAQSFLGYSSAELVDKHTPAIFHDLEEVKQRATELTAELSQPIEPGFEVFVAKASLGMVDDNEWSYIRKDGSRFPVQLSVTALRDQDGKITGFLGIASDITARKEAEKSLRQNELKYHQILDAITDMVLVKAPQSRIVWANKAFRDYYALTNEQLKDMIDAPFNEPDYTLQYVRDDAYVFETGQSLEIEEPVTRYDGKVQIFNTIKSVIRNEAGDKILTVGVSRDISDRKRADEERKQAQSELKDAEKFLRSIYEGVGSLIFVVDVLENQELIYTGWSLSTEKATGIKEKEIIGKSPEAIFGLIEGAAVRQNHLRCLESGTSISYEECLTFYDQETWWLTTLSPIRNNDNRISRIVGTTINISDRKRQEQALRLIVEGTAAKTGEAFFKTCVQYLAQVLDVRYALISEFVDSEKASAKTLAVWSGDGFGDNITYNLVGTPCQDVCSNTEVCRYPNSVHLLFPENDNLSTLQAKSYAGLLIIDAAGNHLGLLAVLDNKPMVKDLEMQSAILRIFATRAGAEIERLRVEAALRESEVQLRKQTQELEVTLKKLQNTQIQLIQAEKMSSLGQLVAGVAHEINNPVSFIYSNIQPANDYASELFELIRLYQAHYPNPPVVISDLTEQIDFEYLVTDFSNLLQSMQKGAIRIRDIVKSLRTFSRLDEADLKDIDIHENIESTLVILQNRLNGRSGKPEILVTKNYGSLPRVECYGGLLNQVFMNLLVNAIDAIESKRDRLDFAETKDYIGEIIITTSINSENQVSISIQDNGCGMTPEIQFQIFNPFFTTKPIGKGTGMGLATSYQIIEEQHRGKILVRSEVGIGTEFMISLFSQ